MDIIIKRLTPVSIEDLRANPHSEFIQNNNSNARENWQDKRVW